MLTESVDTKKNSQDIIKLPYNAPVLLIYGRVTELTQAGSAGSNESSGGMKASSSRHMKENIAKVGVHSLGFGLYLFDYKTEFRGYAGHGRQFGVMIDEVVSVVPAAVSVDESGYAVVDYAMLGIHRPMLH